MPITTPQSRGRSSSNGELLWLHPDQLRANPWNPNTVPDDLYERARESLRRFGWLSPIVVRSSIDAGGSGFEIIDGEHRWRIAVEDGIDPVPVFCVDGLTDAEAKRATVILNDLHGQARPDKLTALFRGLLDEISVDELLIGLPYSPDVLSSLLPDIELPSLPVGPLPEAPSPGGARWVERTYRLPLEAAEVVDDALARARGEDEIEPWQALERIAAEFLAS